MILLQRFSAPSAVVRSWALLLLLAATTATADPMPMASSTSLEPEPRRLEAYAGRWIHRVDESAEVDRFASIDAATLELSWIMRRMATGVLRRTTHPPESLEFSWDGERLHQVATEADGTPPRAVLLDSEPRQWVADNGEETSTHWQWTGSGLRINWQQKQAHGSNTYRVTPDAQALLIEHRIEVTALESVAPIVYRSWFRRAAPRGPEWKAGSTLQPDG